MTQSDSIPREWALAIKSDLCAGNDCICPSMCDLCESEATRIITILRPLIEAETRERCAQIAALHNVSIVGGAEFYDSTSLDIAAAIRAQGE